MSDPSGWQPPGEPPEPPAQPAPTHGWGTWQGTGAGVRPPDSSGGYAPEGSGGHQPDGSGDYQPDPAGAARSGGIIPLRPLGVGEIYDGAVRVIRTNPRTMVGFSALVIAVFTVLATAPQAFALSRIVSSPLLEPDADLENTRLSDVAELVGAGGVALLAGVLQFLLATTIISGLLIVAVVDAVRGERVTPGQLWRRHRSRLPTVLGLTVVIVVVLPLLIGIGFLPGVVLLVLDQTAIGVVLLIVGILAGIAASLALYFGFWAVAVPALMLEHLGIVSALRRSFRLVRHGFWRVFGISLLTTLITTIVGQILTVPFSLIGGLLSALVNLDDAAGTVVQLLVGNLGTVLSGAIVYPFGAGVSALLYLDLRMRREGLDVDVMRS